MCIWCRMWVHGGIQEPAHMAQERRLCPFPPHCVFSNINWAGNPQGWECLHHGNRQEPHIRAPQPHLLTLPDLVHLQHVTGTWGPKNTFSVWLCGFRKTLNFSETFVSHLHHGSVWLLGLEYQVLLKGVWEREHTTGIECTIPVNMFWSL